MIPITHTWIPLLYLYGVGGIFFLIGMIIIRKSGAINLKLKRHRYWYRVLIFGYFYFLIFHTFFTLVGLYW
ncbi:hypothetical protein BMS3Abin04_01098 [bacterium BMS3Abin04]|nr:hypothetical protein BMS3Abin04_01098 [bacterium BMS3Abin04]